MDVNSLYTSIGHQDGTYSFFLPTKKFLQGFTYPDFNKEFFHFLRIGSFIQEKGTAMGSNMAPPYANIFMNQFEETFVYSHPSFTSFVSYWRRYIDDVFLIWTGEIGVPKHWNYSTEISTLAWGA
ncbi:unnamed protein product [Ranitomeya imitator]|uniref:Reverse transcriptase domain-containing protein n=1 Tax=Ranitomeya imitator TaxID=111125 RepID=A0ABN9MHU5_9NEOB|nr:unnamed protein product [Ranitomeya imitator]